MRERAFLLVVVFALSLAAVARKEDSLEQLKARLETATPDQRISLSLEIAQRQLTSADKLYTEGKPDEARAAVNDVVTYSEKAGQAANETGKKLKQAEITVRKMAKKLRDIKRSVNFEDQEPLQDAADRLEHIRSDLLTRMFGPSKK
jgi:hypothetical protein